METNNFATNENISHYMSLEGDTYRMTINLSNTEGLLVPIVGAENIEIAFVLPNGKKLVVGGNAVTIKTTVQGKSQANAENNADDKADDNDKPKGDSSFRCIIPAKKQDDDNDSARKNGQIKSDVKSDFIDDDNNDFDDEPDYYDDDDNDDDDSGSASNCYADDEDEDEDGGYQPFDLHSVPIIDFEVQQPKIDVAPLPKKATHDFVQFTPDEVNRIIWDHKYAAENPVRLFVNNLMWISYETFSSQLSDILAESAEDDTDYDDLDSDALLNAQEEDIDPQTFFDNLDKLMIDERDLRNMMRNAYDELLGHMEQGNYDPQDGSIYPVTFDEAFPSYMAETIVRWEHIKTKYGEEYQPSLKGFVNIQERVTHVFEQEETREERRQHIRRNAAYTYFLYEADVEELCPTEKVLSEFVKKNFKPNPDTTSLNKYIPKYHPSCLPIDDWRYFHRATLKSAGYTLEEFVTMLYRQPKVLNERLSLNCDMFDIAAVGHICKIKGHYSEFSHKNDKVIV
jgi:hypothetical protein